MDGAAFPARVPTRHPVVVPIRLTGRADAPSACAAVDQGQIHRCLNRSSPPELLRSNPAPSPTSGGAPRGIAVGQLVPGTVAIGDIVTFQRPALVTG
jgi:hypothetical protein